MYEHSTQLIVEVLGSDLEDLNLNKIILECLSDSLCSELSMTYCSISRKGVSDWASCFGPAVFGHGLVKLADVIFCYVYTQAHMHAYMHTHTYARVHTDTQGQNFFFKNHTNSAFHIQRTNSFNKAWQQKCLFQSWGSSPEPQGAASADQEASSSPSPGPTLLCSGHCQRVQRNR